ncbi:MAG: hypothetical protein ACPGTQ_13615 [Colwellia sp.]
MWSLIIIVSMVLFVLSMTLLSYKLGLTRTDNAKQTAIIGFCLSFMPPFVLCYLVFLLLKEDAGTI